jgi:hypothetical protein
MLFVLYALIICGKKLDVVSTAADTPIMESRPSDANGIGILNLDMINKLMYNMARCVKKTTQDNN